MRMPTLAALTVAATALLGTSAAFAIPTACYGGVCVPASGVYLDNSLSWETLVQTPGVDVLRGVFGATSISNGQGGFSNITYNGYGAGGTFLAGVFDGFLLNSQVGNQLRFTGGTLKYYTSASDNLTTSGGGAGADIAAIQSGNLWAAFNAAADINGFTLVITLNGTPTNFTGASTDDVFLDVDLSNPSLAGLAFDTNTLIDTNSVLRDLKFTGNASGYNGVSCSTDFQICGTNSAKGFLQAVPEPITLSLFGAGLAGAAALRRRKAQKA